MAAVGAVMLQGQPGETPCYAILVGRQVPRVIGKAGAYIKELRQESGATIDIVDRQLPAALQQSNVQVALVKGSDAAVHSALTGLVRSARGPQALRGVEGEDEDLGFDMLLPEKCGMYLNGVQILEGTECSMHTAAIEGMPRSMRIRLDGPTTASMQVAAWRVHELVLRLHRRGVLSDRDFDLQSAAWDSVMAAFQSAKNGGAKSGAERQAPASEELREILRQPAAAPEVAAALESEARAAKEARIREVQERQERERKAKIREEQVKTQRDREAQARASRTLQAKARETYEKARLTTDASEREVLMREAQALEAQSKDAWSQTFSGLGTQGMPGRPAPEDDAIGPAVSETARAQLQQSAPHYSQESPATRSPPAIKHISPEVQKAQEELHQRELQETQAREREAKAREARDKEVREREERRIMQAASSPVQPVPPAAGHRQGGATVNQEVPAPQAQLTDRSATLGRSGLSRMGEACGTKEVETEQTSPGLPLNFSCRTSDPTGAAAAAAAAAAADERTMSVAAPSMEVAQFLAGCHAGIARRTGTRLEAIKYVNGGGGHGAVLQIYGSPAANAAACFYVQEALWIHGWH